MRTFSDGRLARTTAYLVTAAFLCSVGFTGLAVLPASAQVVTRASTSQSVGVVPFANLTDFRPETLGDEGAAAVAIELRDRLLLDVLPKQDISLQMRDLGMVAPLNDAEIVRLATELNLALMVTGEVRGARIVRSAEGRHGEVVLAVRLFDRMARADVNGAIVAGKGPVIADASDDLLLEKALEQAAFMVLWARGNSVFLNVGTRGGVRTKMKMVAIRGGERIALVEISETDAIGSYGTVVEGPPLRTGDMLRAIYEMAKDAQPDRHGVQEAKKKRFETIALAAAILFGFGSYASRARRIDEGNTSAPGFLASNLADGAEQGRSGYLRSFVEGSLPPPGLQPSPASLITWDGLQGGESQRILAYLLMRSGAIVGVESGGRASYVVVDAANAPAFILLTITIDELTGVVTEWVAEIDVWEPDIDEEGEIGTPYSDFIDDHADDAGIFAEDPTWIIGWFTTAGGDVASITPGFVGQYQVAPIFLQQTDFGVWDIDLGESTTSPNLVQGVVPAGTFSQAWIPESLRSTWGFYGFHENPVISGTEATFFFYYPIGATSIMLQVATSDNFFFIEGADVLRNIPLSPSPPPFEALNVASELVSLSQFPSFVEGRQYWWRIAVQSFRDTHDPRAIGGEDPGLPDWILSTRNLLTATDNVTTARVAGMHDRRDALAAVRAGRAARVPRGASATDRLFRAE
jgi:hypothetical protein